MELLVEAFSSQNQILEDRSEPLMITFEVESRLVTWWAKVGVGMEGKRVFLLIFKVKSDP